MWFEVDSVVVAVVRIEEVNCHEELVESEFWILLDEPGNVVRDALEDVPVHAVHDVDLVLHHVLSVLLELVKWHFGVCRFHRKL